VASLDYLKLEKDRLAPNHEAQVLLPEAAEEAQGRVAVATVDEQLEADETPQLQHRDADQARAQADVTVEVEVGAVVGEVGEGFGRQMPAVSRVGVGSDVGKVRRVEADERTRLPDAVQLGDDGQHIIDVLDHLIADEQIKLVVGEWVWHVVQVVDDIGPGARVIVEADAAGRLMLAAADVENFHYVPVLREGNASEHTNNFGARSDNQKPDPD